MWGEGVWLTYDDRARELPMMPSRPSGLGVAWGGGFLFPRALDLRLVVSLAVLACPSLCFYSLRIFW